MNDYVHIVLAEQVEKLPLSPTDLEEATRSDPILQEVLSFTRDGWGGNSKQKWELAPYYERHNELSVEGNCLFCGLFHLYFCSKC